MKVLLIEDQAHERGILRHMLELEGYAVIEAADGKAGLGLFAAEAPDIVLTDLLMPGQEGIETITRLRSIDPAVTIIAMSGGGQLQGLDLLEMAKRLGANAVLAKPFTRGELVAVLSGTLPAHRIRR